MAKRPNFLFFITDQHRVDYLGCTGHPVLKTPHIDSIAARGTRFERFYVATPVCMPNRSTLMTGRMPSVHGVRSNGTPLSLNSNTFVDALRAGGYATSLVGKSHLQNFSEFPAILKRPPPRDGDQVLDAEFRGGAQAGSRRDGPYDQEHPARWEPGRDFEMKLPFYGFEHVDLCTTHGDQVGGHYYVWLKARRPDADALRDHKNQLPHDYVCPQAFRTPIPEELYPTAYIADKSCEWLDRYAAGDRDKPFFLMTSFPDPHHPFTPPGKYWSMYRPEDMALPPSFDHGNRPLARSDRVGAGAARERQGQHLRTGGVRRQRARGARGDGAELRHDHDDRRCHRSRPRYARGEWPRRRHDRDLHHRPRRFSRRPSSDAEGPGALRGDHPRAVHLGRARQARRPARRMCWAARSTSRRRSSIVPASSPTTASRAKACCPRSAARVPRTAATRW